MYNLLRNVALALYKPFMNDKMKSFIDKRLKQNFSDLKIMFYLVIIFSFYLISYLFSGTNHNPLLFSSRYFLNSSE